MNKQLASESIGKIVEVFAGQNGNYIGQIENILPGSGEVVVINILACIKYPEQRAIFYTFNSFERWPFYYGSKETCHITCIELFYGTIPEYYDIMPRVLDETFQIETEADREIYERHKKHWTSNRG